MTTTGHELYPLRFDPVFKAYPWGGRAIAAVLGRDVPSGPVAESWEISAHRDGSTPIVNGSLRGRNLSWLLETHGEALVGRNNRDAIDRRRFPLLVKILDANDWLSVQVHPDDDYALANEGDLGKSEMWIVLAAEPGAEILLGFRAEVDPQTFGEAILSGRVPDCLHATPARPGDVFFVPPGTIHAIGPGVLLAEIQQSSNVTYRISDWGRIPQRTLHVDRALEVLDFDAVEPGPIEPKPDDATGRELLASCRRFHTERLRLAPGQRVNGNTAGRSFEIWGTLEGAATVEAGDTASDLVGVSWLLLPASLGEFELRASEPTTLLRVLTPPAS
jgi:mannose-6-phosphate isomerase